MKYQSLMSLIFQEKNTLPFFSFLFLQRYVLQAVFSPYRWDRVEAFPKAADSQLNPINYSEFSPLFLPDSLFRGLITLEFDKDTCGMRTTCLSICSVVQ